MIEIVFSHTDARTAQAVLEQFVTLFIGRQSQIYGNPQAEVLKEQAQSAYEKMVAGNREMLNFKEQVGVSNIDEEISLLLTQRSNITSYLSQYGSVSEGQGDSAIATDDNTQQDAQAQRPVYSIVPAKRGVNGKESPFPALDEIRSRIEELRTQENEMLQTYRANSDVVVKIRQNIEAETISLYKAVDALKEKMKELDSRLSYLNENKAKSDVLARKVEFAEGIYKTAESRLQAAQVNDDLNSRKITQVSVIESPVLPEKPASPRKFMTLLLCLIVSGVFGAAAIILSELLDLSFSTPEQLAAHLEKPVLASFSYNYITASGLLRSIGFKEFSISKFSAVLPFLAAYDAGGKHKKNLLFKENVANLYQGMVAQGQIKDGVVCFSSAYAGEGVSTVSWELANFMVDTAGKKVLFMDTVGSFVPDQSSLTRPALLDVISGGGELTDMVVEMDTPEQKKISVAQFFNKKDHHKVLANMLDINKALQQLKSEYDVILLPVSNVISDSVAVAMASLSDAAVFVVEADRTRAPVVKQAVQILKDSGTNIVGMVLNKRMMYIPRWMYNII